MEAKHKENVINFLIKYRYVVGVLSIVLTVLLALPAKNLYFESDYKIYFEKNDANLLAHEEMQDVYTKTDNLAIIIQPADKNVFTNENLAIVREITELSWQAPYVIRVDSLSNFQHTSAQGDDLSVADLVPDVDELSAIDLEYIKSVALKEKSMVGRLVSVDGSTTLINITVELPPVADPNADFEIQAKQRLLHDSSYPEIVEFGRQIVTDFEDRYPNMEMHLTGVSVVTNSFNESTIKDMSSLVPMMYVVIMVMLAVFLRSISSIVGALLVIACASVVGVSCAAWLGYGRSSRRCQRNAGPG